MTLTTAAATLWALSQNPFTEPLVEKSTLGAKTAYIQALSRNVSSGWLEPKIEAALEAQDTDELAIYLDLATQQNIELSAGLSSRAMAFLASENGFINQASDCAACAVEISSCKRLAHIASCAVPVELTPVGDLNALRRAGV